MTDTVPVSPPSRLLAYAQLLRLPNVFTALADVAMGILFVASFDLRPVAAGLLLLASSCLYLSGMVWNDLFDVEVDRRERPTRPLPSGRISVRSARILAVGLMFVGLTAAWAVGLPSGVCGTTLAGLILAYDGYLKRNSLLGPFAMGACRTCNILMGMSVLGAVPHPAQSPASWCVAIAIGVYIAGVTWFARQEVDPSRRGGLILGLVVILAGLGLLGAFPWIAHDIDRPFTRFTDDSAWPILLGLLSMSVVRRAVLAIAKPDPSRVQAAVKTALLSLIVYDASICLAVVGPVEAVAVLCLLAPALMLGRWVYST